MKRGLLTSMLLVLLGAFSAFAQERTISGTVLAESDNTPLPGVSIIVKGTTTGTQTDFNGNYTLKVPESAEVLVFSYLGNKKEAEIGDQSTIDITIVDVLQTDEVVVTGYQTTAKERSSISAQTVGQQNIEKRPNASFAQTLSGQVAGLNITTSNGQPGGNSTINLRGVGSINGNTEPLFIIDGTPVDEDNFRSLNPNEIESVTVLKDAGATAIYGNRGANGVVVIKTKGGSYGSGLEIEYLGQVNFTQLQTNDYDLMNAQEQLRLENEVGRGRGAGLTEQEIANAANTDWVDYFFDAGLSNSHTLAISNGKENIRTFTSIGFLDQDGVLRSSDLQRYNLRNNISGRSANEKLNYSLNTTVNYSRNNEPNSIGSSAINRNFVLAAYQSVPYITPDDYVDGRSLLSPLLFANTPLFLIDRLNTYQRREDEIKIIGSADVSYEFIEGLTGRLQVGMDFTNEQLLRSEGPESFNALLFAQGGNETPGFAQQLSTQNFSYNALASLNYSKTFNDVHSINIGVFGETFQARLNQFGYFAEGLDPKTFSPGDDAGYVGDNTANDFFVDDATATKREAGLLSYFGNVDYDYGSRFGANVTIRRDASYRFTESNRWGTFYSVGARWNIHNEAFMDGLPFDILKLRASYGKTGNQRIVDAAGFFGYYAAPNLTRSLYQTGIGYQGQNSIFLNQIGNDALRWENVFQGNVGVDIEMFQSRLRGVFDVYVRRTTDLFQNRPISAINSITSIRANIGELENRGFDFQLDYDIFREDVDGFGFTFGVVGNYNVQEVLEIPTPEGFVVNADGFTGLNEGGIINEYYVYRYAGVNPENGELQFLTADGELTENPNVDTDRVWTGENIYPDVFGSFNLNFDYKGLFLQMQWNYTLGAKRFDFDYSGFVNPDNIGQFRTSRDILDSWTPENTDAALPSLTASNRGLGFASDRFLRDNDYFRLRFISLGYNLPKSLLDQVNLNSASVFVNGENLLTFTEWRGFDPESLNATGSRLYPSPRILSVGLEVAF
mgnify:CR=1 FL=1